jgi:hypothetical protein
MSLQLLADSRLVEKKPSTAEQAPAHVSNDGMWSFLLGVIYPVVHPHLNFTKHISWDMDILLNHSQLHCCIQNPIYIYDPFLFFWINYSRTWASWIHAMLSCHIVIMFSQIDLSSQRFWFWFRFVLSLVFLISANHIWHWSFVLILVMSSCFLLQQLQPALTSRDNRDPRTWRDRNSWGGKLHSISHSSWSPLCYIDLLMNKDGAGLRGAPDWWPQVLPRT